jgi:hypothetical protein
MKKKYIVLAATISLIILLSGCAEQKKPRQNNNEEEIVGIWENTTIFKWTNNGTCCGEKEQQKQEYILDGEVNDTRWVDTGRTRDNNSALPEDGWYITKSSSIYSREEEYRKYICHKGECIFSVTDTRWYQTGAIIIKNISSSRDVSVKRGDSIEWYVVVEPVGDENVDIIFNIYSEGNISLPSFSSHDLKNAYHTGEIELPEEYNISLKLYSGNVTVYVLDEVGYNQLFE